MWPTWNQAAVATVVLIAVAVPTRRLGRRWATFVSEFAAETALVSFLYMLWRLARFLPLTHEQGALDRGRAIYHIQNALHIPSEKTFGALILPHPLLARSLNVFYATAHVPTLLAFLVWLFIRHRDQYGRWRNALAILTAFCLFIRFIRVAPPRLMPELGFVDMAARFGQSVYGPVGTGVSDQYAAMPSIHVGWAAVVAFGVVSASPSRWRYLALGHVLLTAFVVGATASHWWLDGAVAVGLLGLALVIDQRARQLMAWMRRPAPEVDFASSDPSPELAGAEAR